MGQVATANDSSGIMGMLSSVANLRYVLHLHPSPSWNVSKNPLFIYRSRGRVKRPLRSIPIPGRLLSPFLLSCLTSMARIQRTSPRSGPNHLTRGCGRGDTGSEVLPTDTVRPRLKWPNSDSIVATPQDRPRKRQAARTPGRIRRKWRPSPAISTG